MNLNELVHSESNYPVIHVLERLHGIVDDVRENFDSHLYITHASQYLWFIVPKYGKKLCKLNLNDFTEIKYEMSSGNHSTLMWNLVNFLENQAKDGLLCIPTRIDGKFLILTKFQN